MSRRRLLQLSAIGGTAVLTGFDASGADGLVDRGRSPGPEPQVVVPPPAPTADPANGVTFFAESEFSSEAHDLNFQVLFALGGVGYGAGETGEIIATINQIQAAGPSYQTYYDNFVDTGIRVAALADSALKAGHLASARSAYLRAAQYFDQALYFVLATSTPAAEPTVYAAMQRQWNLAALLMDPPFERVAIPYGKTTLPGYFLKASTSNVRRPTVIVNNGSDAQLVDIYAWGGAAGLERGYNVLLFEGPGQGSVLFQRQIGFRPDWEHVISPIVDWLRARPDVDTKRIGLTGWSFCGESVARAAAFEHRLGAVCSDPGIVDAWLAWPTSIRSLFSQNTTQAQVDAIWTNDIVPHVTDPSEKFGFTKRSEIYGAAFLSAARAGRLFPSLWEFGQTAMQYNCGDVVDRIDTPYLVMNYELENFYPGGAQSLFGALPGRKTLATMTTADGAEYHDAPMAPQRRNQVVFDWLDDTMRV
ncbi:MAG TPA: hypothetical protein VHZ02_09935 [Acidimicrobiales bacterium]|nr:hypothetical protein [Acidimicrobiales bacterium]